MSGQLLHGQAIKGKGACTDTSIFLFSVPMSQCHLITLIGTCMLLVQTLSYYPLHDHFLLNTRLEGRWLTDRHY